MRIEKKIQLSSFQRIIDGEKNYEVRLADWDCNIGDVLVLKEWNSETKEYTGRTIKKIITHVRKTKDINFWPKEEIEKHGFQIIAFKQPSDYLL